MDDLLKEFLTETSENIIALDSALVRIEQQPDDPQLLSEIFRVMHTIKGTCGFLDLPRLERVAHAGENVLGQFRDGTLAVDREAIGVVLDALDCIKSLLAAIAELGSEPSGSDEAIVRRLNAVVAAGELPHTAQPAAKALYHRLGGLAVIDAAVEAAHGSVCRNPAFGEMLDRADTDTLQAALRDCLSAVTDAPVPLPRRTLHDVLSHAIGVDVGSDLVAALVGALDEALASLEIAGDVRREILSCLAQAKPQPAPAPDDSRQSATDHDREQPPAMAPQSVRVGIDLLEQLMTVVSELVLIRNQLLQTLRHEPESAFAAPLERLNLVTTELQEAVMTTRMQPIGTSWAKLPRIVRDLAVQLSKKIELETHGAETELDRQVLDLIRDPLTHMIRNAADHGIEQPAERLAAGKPECGRIALHARHEGGHIVVDVCDDGRGLPTAKLRRKAIQLGLCSADEADAISDDGIHRLIFHAGLSTADSVTSVSGRGVGMDVVRSNIEKSGGTIVLSSAEGHGTRITIRIPLTLTIISALIVGAGGERFAIPQSSIVELVGTASNAQRAVEYVNGAPVIRLRGRLLPLLPLPSLLGLDPVESPAADGCIVVIQIGAQTFGIIVDRVFDTEEIVVKPVAKILRDIALFSGNTILGDGDVIMILDPKGICAKLGAGAQMAADPVESAHDIREAATRLLVLRSGAIARKAVPLALVSRIEDVETSRIERVAGRTVLQYRGRLIPLLPLEEADAERSPADGMPRKVLIIADGDRAMGLEVDDIIDIAETRIVTEVDSAAPGLLGSLIVDGVATDLIDIGYYWAKSGAAEVNAAGRILLVDPSPFACNLLVPILGAAGYIVETAASVEDARALPGGMARFDAILADTARTAIEDRSAAERLADSGETPVIGLLDDAGDDGRTVAAHIFRATARKGDRAAVLAALSQLSRRAG
jgi:two-component system chemotaxis sensor kinase CheA